MITMAQRLQKLSSICKERNRLRNRFDDPKKIARLENQASRVFQGIMLAADFSGTTWHFRHRCPRLRVGRKVPWELMISGSLLSVHGDIPVVREAFRIIDSPYHIRLVLNKIAATINASLIFYVDKDVLTMSFTANEKSRRFLARRKIRIDLVDYEKAIEQERASLMKTMTDTRKIVRFMHEEG